jgi:hypothetical protein
MVTSALFGATCVAVWLAALRVADRWVGAGWPRIAAAAGLFGLLATAVPLACGLAGLGTSPAALAGVSLAVALGAGARAGRKSIGVLAEGAPGTLAAAAGGAGVALLAEQVALPRVRTDGFHLLEVVRWLRDGHPGALLGIDPSLPFDHYPLANELILTWGAGIARGFAPVSLWASALVFLLAGSAFCALRARDVETGPAALAAGAALLLAVAVANVDGSGTSFAAVAWTAAALSVLLRPAPLLGPGLLLAGLAVGTKTNCVFVLAPVLAWAIGQGPRDRAAWLGALGGLLVAAPWPLRNLIEHGSPLWPFSRVLGIGDPLPSVLRQYQSSFLDDPVAAARAYADVDLPTVARLGLALAGALALAPLARRRDVTWLAALAGGCTLLWAIGPLSGPVPGGVSHAQIAYALPGALVAVLATGLACGAASPWARRLAQAALLAQVLACAYVLPRGTPFTNLGLAVLTLGGGALLGVAVVPRLWALRGHVALPVGAAVAIALLTVVGIPRFTDLPERHAPYAPILNWLADQPGYRDGDLPVRSDILDARFAGPRFEHDVRALPERPDCAALRREPAWVVIFRQERFGVPPVPAAACFAGVTPGYEDFDVRIYAVKTGP